MWFRLPMLGHSQEEKKFNKRLMLQIPWYWNGEIKTLRLLAFAVKIKYPGRISMET